MDATLGTIFAAGLGLMLLAGLPPCPTEDSRNCRWDAQTRGNGQGSSFIDLGGQLIRF